MHADSGGRISGIEILPLERGRGLVRGFIFRLRGGCRHDLAQHILDVAVLRNASVRVHHCGDTGKDILRQMQQLEVPHRYYCCCDLGGVDYFLPSSGLVAAMNQELEEPDLQWSLREYDKEGCSSDKCNWCE